uniref:Uncharacterized protein n=1 Tax=Tetraselmis sp. GSL018 TaxID=582737 RepID=A0A061S763_9CHLO
MGVELLASKILEDKGMGEYSRGVLWLEEWVQLYNKLTGVLDRSQGTRAKTWHCGEC